MDAIPAIPAVAIGNLRRSSLIAGIVGLVGVAITALFGHWLAGVLALLGIALGAANTYLVQRQVVRYAASEKVNKKALFTKGVLNRLAMITVVAGLLAWFVRPDGLGVLCGLAVFQMVMIGGATVPVYRELKRPSAV